MIGEVLALDKDDCFKPMTRPFLEMVYSHTGVLLKPEDGVPGEYHFDKAHPQCGITAEEFTELIDMFMLEHSVKVEPFPDAIEAIERLAQICDIHIVTAREPRHTEVTHESLERHFDLSFFKGIHVIGSTEPTKKTTKIPTYIEIGATSAADDADHNINAAIETGLTGFSVQYPGLYHSGHRLDERAIVVSSLTEILKYADMPVG